MGMGSYYWACYECGASNSLRVQRCRACGYVRPESLTPPPSDESATTEPQAQQASMEAVAQDAPQDLLSRLTKWADANPPPPPTWQPPATRSATSEPATGPEARRLGPAAATTRSTPFLTELRLTHADLDFWVDVTVRERDGRYMATANLGEDSRDVGLGYTAQEAVRAALRSLGEPYASEMADGVDRDA